MTDPEFKNKMTDSVKDDDLLMELGIVDSFGLIHLVGELEKLFGIKVVPSDLKKKNFESIAAMEQFVLAKQS